MKGTNDPYQGLLDLHSEIAANAGKQAVIRIGEIVSPPPSLKILVNGMTLDSRWSWVDEYWVQGHERHTKGVIVSATQNRAGGGGYAEFASHNHDIDNPYTENMIMTDTWHVGDKVALLPLVGDDDKTMEQYIVLCKLIRLDGN